MPPFKESFDGPQEWILRHHGGPWRDREGVRPYLETHQAENYRRLSAVRSDGDWESWVTFFLEGVEIAAEDAQRSIVAIAARISSDRKRVLGMAGSTLQALRRFERLPTMPKLTIEN